MDDTEILTPHCGTVLSFFQHNDQTFVGKDLIELTGIKGVYPVLNSLVKKRLLQPAEPVMRPFTDKNGKVQIKEYKTYELTDRGREFKI